MSPMLEVLIKWLQFFQKIFGNYCTISLTSYSWEILRADWLETGLSSDHNSKLTVPVPQWMKHLKTSPTLNRLTNPRPRRLSMSIHSPEMRIHLWNQFPSWGYHSMHKHRTFKISNFIMAGNYLAYRVYSNCKFYEGWINIIRIRDI